MKRWIIELLLGLAAVGLIFVLTFPWEETKEQTKRSMCLSNVKRRALASIMYAEDSDRRFPDGKHWMDTTEIYLKPKPPFYEGEDRDPDRTLRCPSVFRIGFGYAFDAALSMARSPSRPESAPLIYDSSNLARNASDRVTSLPQPARHDERDNVAYADGHAKAVTLR